MNFPCAPPENVLPVPAERAGIGVGSSGGTPMDGVRYFIALVMFFVVPLSVLFWLTVHPFVRFWRRLGAAWTYCIVLALLAVAGAAASRAVHRLLAVEYGTNYVLVVLGLAVLVAAGWMRKGIAKHLKNWILIGLPELEPKRHRIALLTGGPYGVIRHPRYVQYLLALVGWSLISNYLALYVLCALAVPGLALVAALEERELRRRFGAEWDAYARRVPMLIPRLRRRA